METQIQGYPIAVYYIIAFIGLVLLIFRPRWAFLFIVFCLVVRNFHMAVFTRTPFLGAFLNLNDLCLWIGVLAMLRTSLEGGRIWFPNILLAIIAILVLGDFQAIFQYGFDYEVMQSCWGSWVFPIMFAVAANMVKDSKDARLFYWVFFLGSVGAGLQHLLFVHSYAVEGMIGSGLIDRGAIRTISFIMSGGIFLVISALFIDMRRFIKSYVFFIFWIIGLSLIAISYVLSFTRGVWLGAFLSSASLFFLFYKEGGKIVARVGYSLMVLAMIIVVFKLTSSYMLPGVKVEESIDRRADFIRYEDTFEEAYQTRETGMETELNLWRNGSLIWGVGASYPPSLLDSSIEAIGALHHVGFSSYLAHFGLIGLIIYGLLLPFLTIKVGRRYYLQHKQDFGGVIAVTAMALAFYDVFTLLTSNHYLGPTSHIQGLLYGAVWGLSRSPGVNPARNNRPAPAPVLNGAGPISG
jgi:hypothetical protein